MGIVDKIYDIADKVAGETVTRQGNTIVAAIDALNDALAGSDQPAAQSVTEALTLLKENAGGGGELISISPKLGDGSYEPSDYNVDGFNYVDMSKYPWVKGTDFHVYSNDNNVDVSGAELKIVWGAGIEESDFTSNLSTPRNCKKYFGAAYIKQGAFEDGHILAIPNKSTVIIRIPEGYALQRLTGNIKTTGADNTPIEYSTGETDARLIIFTLDKLYARVYVYISPEES